MTKDDVLDKNADLRKDPGPPLRLEDIKAELAEIRKLVEVARAKHKEEKLYWQCELDVARDALREARRVRAAVDEENKNLRAKVAELEVQLADRLEKLQSARETAEFHIRQSSELREMLRGHRP